MGVATKSEIYSTNNVKQGKTKQVFYKHVEGKNRNKSKAKKSIQ